MDELYYQSEMFQGKAMAATQATLVSPDLKTKVNMEISTLEQMLAKKRELLQLLENNPEFERMLSLLKGY